LAVAKKMLFATGLPLLARTVDTDAKPRLPSRARGMVQKSRVRSDPRFQKLAASEAPK
jgi:hypothetical protein